MPSIQDAIKEIDELEKKATKGRWFYDGINYLFTEEADGNNQMIADDHDDTIRMRGVGAKLPLEINAQLIVLLRNSWPAIREEIERLQEIEFRYNSCSK